MKTTELLTRREVAQRLRVSTKTVDRMRSSGQLATKWVGENSPRITMDSFKRFLAAAGCFAIMAFAQAVEINGALIHAVGMVESNMNHRAVGDQGKANGFFQMHLPAWSDCSRWLKKNGFKPTSYEKGVNDPNISHQYCKIYLSLLNAQLKRSLGREPSAAEVYASFNLGYTGFKRRGFQLDKTPEITQNAIVKLHKHLK